MDASAVGTPVTRRTGAGLGMGSNLLLLYAFAHGCASLALPTSSPIPTRGRGLAAVCGTEAPHRSRCVQLLTGLSWPEVLAMFLGRGAHPQAAGDCCPWPQVREDRFHHRCVSGNLPLVAGAEGLDVQAGQQTLHLSPLGREHINLTGDSIWRQIRRVEQGELRPLRVGTEPYRTILPVSRAAPHMTATNRANGAIMSGHASGSPAQAWSLTRRPRNPRHALSDFQRCPQPIVS